MKINSVNLGNATQQNINLDNVNKNVKGQSPTQNISDISIKDNNIGSDKLKAGKQESEIMEENVLEKSIEQANKSLEMYNRRIERAIHEVTHAVIYTVKDTVTNEVIQEFPPRKIQDMIAKMWELAGLFVDEKA